MIGQTEIDKDETAQFSLIMKMESLIDYLKDDFVLMINPTLVKTRSVIELQ